MKMSKIEEHLKLFKYYNIEIIIHIPYEGTINELACILKENHNLPKYDTDFVEALGSFIKASTYESLDTSKLVKTANQNKIDYEDVTKDWEKMIRDEMADHGERRCASDEELFATAYHKMVHSPALETMLQLEHMYAQTVNTRCEEKDQKIRHLSDRQTDEMNRAVDRLEDDMTEMSINELVAQHFEDQTFLQVQLTSELDTIKEVQRREYREWLMQMLEQNQENSSLSTPIASGATTNYLTSSMDHNVNICKDLCHPIILEESFTIHLGSQLKQMHNIRILSTNIMDLCVIKDNKSSEPTPETLQTALNLYSNDLHGLVLITDTIIGSRSGIKEFKEICQSSTEFHFAHIEDQLDKVHWSNEAHNATVRNKTKHLHTGDFYMTHHSNLSQVHVVFHIVADDSTLRGSSSSSDINSRHPVVLGLRNILKTACSNDVTSLTIPLLLNYEMSEDMTISWCEKRAELVFKCIKGFMIEMASWGGSDLKNLQFTLPPGISNEVFQSLTEMLPRIFKLSNPLILK